MDSNRSALQRPNSQRSTAVRASVMLLLILPAEIWLFNRVIGWPLDLTLILTLPLFAVFIPAASAIAIVGTEFRRRGLSVYRPEFFILTGLLGAVAATFTGVALAAYVVMRPISSIEAIVFGVIGVMTAVSGFIISRKYLATMRQVASSKLH